MAGGEERAVSPSVTMADATPTPPDAPPHGLDPPLLLRRGSCAKLDVNEMHEGGKSFLACACRPSFV